jgi:hypothetical protein
MREMCRSVVRGGTPISFFVDTGGFKELLAVEAWIIREEQLRQRLRVLCVNESLLWRVLRPIEQDRSDSDVMLSGEHAHLVASICSLALMPSKP